MELFARRATAGQLGREDLLDDEAMAALRVYRWPGNVRELAAVVKRLSLFVDPGRPLGLAALPRTITAPAVATADRIAGRLDLGVFMAGAEKAKIVQVLLLADGNRSEAARLLGISRNTLYIKMRKLAIDVPVE